MGTRTRDRLARGEERGYIELDELCRLHDIAYCKSGGGGNVSWESRRVADQALAGGAWKLYKRRDIPLGERVAAWLVTSAMDAKIKVGGKIGGGVGQSRGRQRRRRQNKTKKEKCWKNRRPRRRWPRPATITLSKLMKKARDVVRGTSSIVGAGRRKSLDSRQLRSVTMAALKAVKSMRKGRTVNFNRARVLPLPKSGGILPLHLYSRVSALSVHLPAKQQVWLKQLTKLKTLDAG